MKKVVVIGDGFIASHLKYDIAKCRLTPNENEMYSFIRNLRADVLINATGFCGKPNVDQCEVKKIETYTGNVIIPLMLAEACARRDMHMIHLGSGCIYYGNSPSATTCYQMNCLFGDVDGETTTYNNIASHIEDTGWKETDFANAESHYSKTKYACDLAIGSMKNVTTLRLRMPISPKDHPRNLLNKLLGYQKVVEEPNSVTFMEDLINAIDYAIEKEKFGIYHITSPKPLTHSVLLEEYKKYVNNHEYISISKEDLSKITVAQRSNCILDVRKAISEGFIFENTDDAVKRYVKEFVNNK